MLNIKDNGDGTWTIRQELTQKGVAEIWDITRSTLLDTKNFRVVEITLGIVDYIADWYHISNVYYVESWNYHWQITGVYHFVGEGMNFLQADFWDNVSYDYWVKGTGWIVYWSPA